MRLGLFGGTFDPPHIGHLLAASDAHELLALDRLVFIPAAQQPLKLGRTVAAAEDRLGMVEAMVTGDARFAVDAIEINRSGLSFTVETLEAYAGRYPDAVRFLCVGADTLASFDAWREPARILALAQLAVLTRAEGRDSMADADEARRRVHALTGSGGGGIEPRILATRRIDVSSSEIRARVRAGKPIHGFVTEAVARYIESRGLYHQGQA